MIKKNLEKLEDNQRSETTNYNTRIDEELEQLIKEIGVQLHVQSRG